MAKFKISTQIKKEVRTTFQVGEYSFDKLYEARSFIRERKRLDWFKKIEASGKFNVKAYHLELLKIVVFGFDHHPDYDDWDTQIGIPFLRGIELPASGSLIGRWTDQVKIGLTMKLAPSGYNEAGCPLFDKKQQELIERTYLEMKIVLDILTSCLSIQEGNYQLVDPTNKNWQKI